MSKNGRNFSQIAGHKIGKNNKIFYTNIKILTVAAFIRYNLCEHKSRGGKCPFLEAQKNQAGDGMREHSGKAKAEREAGRGVPLLRSGGKRSEEAEPKDVSFLNRR